MTTGGRPPGEGADHPRDQRVADDPRARAAAFSRGTALRVSALFALAGAAGAGLVVVWWRHGSTQLAGVLLAIALAALSAGLALWANRLTPQGPFVEPTPPLADPGLTDEARDDVAEGASLPHRRLVVTGLVGAAATLGAALAVPLSSLGPRPRSAMLRTGWSAGRRAVGADGRVVRAVDVPRGGIATVFPEGDVGAADGQVVLVRVAPRRLELPQGRESWAPDGIVAYSKVCTHAGCPVGLYSAATHELLCPCHQSAFDVLRGARPIHGPAAWPLPQLPIRLDATGAVVADGELSAPVGPGWWKEDA